MVSCVLFKYYLIFSIHLFTNEIGFISFFFLFFLFFFLFTCNYARESLATPQLWFTHFYAKTEDINHVLLYARYIRLQISVHCFLSLFAFLVFFFSISTSDFDSIMWINKNKIELKPKFNIFIN